MTEKDPNCLGETEWVRTGDKNSDLLTLYETGRFYDCTLRGGNDKFGYRDFKCHKLVLASASSVFEKLLFGNFKEAALCPDEPIMIKDVEPSAMDLAIRYIYGGKTEFDSTLSAIQLYKFSDMMDLKILTEKVENYLQELIFPVANIFAIFDLWVVLNKKEKLPKSWEIINKNPVFAFGSPDWLSVSDQSVMEVVQAKNINMKESDLLLAVVEWGRAQVKKEENIGEASNLQIRARIELFIRHIRFGAMSAKEFLRVCESTTILTYEEKFKILQCIETESPENMPAEFLKSMRTRNSVVLIPFSYAFQKAHVTERVGNTHTLFFSVDKPAVLIGLQVDPLDPILGENGSQFTVIVYDQEKEMISEIKPENVTKFDSKNTEMIYGKSTVSLNYHLQCNRFYVMKITNQWEEVNMPHIHQEFHLNVMAKSDWLTLTFHDEYYVVRLAGMVFKPLEIEC